MAKFIFEGIDEYMQKLSGFEKETDHIVNAALYEGAKVLGDCIKKQIDGIPTRTNAKNELKVGLTEKQKQGLKEGFGIAHFWHDTNGTYTKPGFDGYNSVVTKKYPRGQPNALIARSICKGTTYQAKHDFVKMGLAAAKAPAKAAIQKELEEQIKKRIK